MPSLPSNTRRWKYIQKDYISPFCFLSDEYRATVFTRDDINHYIFHLLPWWDGPRQPQSTWILRWTRTNLVHLDIKMNQESPTVYLNIGMDQESCRSTWMLRCSKMTVGPLEWLEDLNHLESLWTMQLSGPHWPSTTDTRPGLYLSFKTHGWISIAFWTISLDDDFPLCFKPLWTGYAGSELFTT